METCTGAKDRITDNCDKLAFNDFIYLIFIFKIILINYNIKLF